MMDTKEGLAIERLAYPQDESSALKEAWNERVRASGGYFTQLFEWMEVSSRAFGFDPHPLGVSHDGIFSSICPLTFNPLSKELQSPPLMGLGGPLPTSELSLYLPELDRLSVELGAERISIQLACDDDTLTRLKESGYNTDHRIPYYVLDIDGEENFAEIRKGFSHGAKRKQNLSRRKGVTVDILNACTESLLSAHEIYLETMEHNRAQNVLPQKLFAAIGALFSGHTVLFRAMRDGNEVGMAICFVSGATIKSWFILGRVAERKSHVNNALYCAIVEYAVRKKIRYVDYGPSGVFSNAHEIKVGHGGRPRWVTTAVKIKNPLKAASYALKKRTRKKAVEDPDSVFSKFFQKYSGS